MIAQRDMREMSCPAPQGAGGLKYLEVFPQGERYRSRPARGGWIEIATCKDVALWDSSRPARGGWIEIIRVSSARAPIWSRPARGGWIEIRRNV